MNIVFVKNLIETSKLPLNGEKNTQAALAELFDQFGIKYQRELRLRESDIIDFLLPDGIGIEVKLKGQRSSFARQISRYLSHDTVTALLLVTSRSIVLPSSHNGKPIEIASLSKGWL